MARHLRARVSISEWRAVLEGLRTADFEQKYTVNGKRAELPGDLAHVFARTDEASVSLSVFAAGVQLNCHFFDECEIEFDLDPREVVGQLQLSALIDVMRILAAATRRSALMTPENMHEIPFLRVSPDGQVDYISSGGFFERMARGRS